MKRMILLLLVFTAIPPVFGESSSYLNSARELFDQTNASPEIFILPREILKAVQSVSPVVSPTKERLEKQFQQAEKFFRMPVTGVILLKSFYDLWDSDDLKNTMRFDWAEFAEKLKKSDSQFNDQEKTLLIFGLSLVELQALRSSDERSDRRLVEKFQASMDSEGPLKKALLEVDPFYRQQMTPDRNLKIVSPEKSSYHHWTKTELRSIQQMALEIKGELDEANLSEVLKKTRHFKRAQIEQEGWLRNFVEEDDDGNKSIKPALPVTALSLTLFAILLKAWWTAESEAEVVTQYPRSQESYEKQMGKNLPLEWRSELINTLLWSPEWDSAQRLEKIRSLIENPKQKVITDITDKGGFKNPAFEEARFMAWSQKKGKAVIEALVKKHRGEAYLEKILEKIKVLEALGDERHASFIRQVLPALQEIEGVSVRDAHRIVIREYRSRLSFEQAEKQANKALAEAWDQVVQAFPRAARANEMANRDRSLFSLARWTPQFSAARQMSSERQAFQKALNPQPGFFKGWRLAAMEIPYGTEYSAMVPGDAVNASALNFSCERIVSKLGRGVGWAVALSGLGYGLSRLAFKPDPDQELRDEERKIKKLKLQLGLEKTPASSSLSTSIYLSKLKSEWETWASTNHREVIISELTEPAAETGLSSQVFVLIKAKDISLSEKEENARHGILLRFLLSSEGTNTELASRFGMKPEFVPQRIFWSFDKLRVLTGDFLDSKVVVFKRGADIEINLDYAKDAIANTP